MWSFGNPKSSTAVIIIAILLFEMNAIASIKLQSFNNNRARRNLLTSDIKCCSDIVHRRAKRLITLQLWTTQRNGPSLYSQISTFAAASIASVIGAGLGFGAGLIGAGVGSFWKTVTSSSQTVQTSVQTDSRNPIPPPLTANTKCCSDVARRRIKNYVDVGTLAAVGGLIGIDIDLGVDVGSAGDGKTTYPSHYFINHFDDGCS